MSDSLFDAEPLRTVPEVVEPEKMTAGERLRRRQAARIASGLHPLSMNGAIIRLLDGPRPLDKGQAGHAGPYKSCGDCVFRQAIPGGNRDFPKCVFGARTVTRTWGGPQTYVYTERPRASHSESSDVRAWWPACVNFEATP